MRKVMTQDEFISYLKRKAKALEMDYTEMLERRAYLKFQAECLAKEEEEIEEEKQETEDYGKQAHIYAIGKVQFMYDYITSDEAFEAYWQIFQKEYKELTDKSID